MYSWFVDVLLGTKEAAQRLGIDQSHLRRLLEQRKLKGKKLGRDWVVLSLDYERKRAPKKRRDKL